MSEALEELVAAVTASSKYATITPDLIWRIGAEELVKRPRLKEAVKATKNKLHQIAGVYLSAPPDYAKLLEMLKSDPDANRKLMAYHASTRERLPIIEQFYRETLASIPPARTVIDLACGLNPLAIPFMPLAEDAEYHAYDIYTDMMDFLSAAIPLLGVCGGGHARDITSDVPDQPVDLALVIKAIPCLEQLDKGVGARLLDGLNAKHILVSYPTRSLGGGDKGMRANYDASFQRMIAGKSWAVQRFDFENELAYLITTRPQPSA